MTLDTVKNYLDITWSDADTDTKVQGILARAESTLNGYAGEPIDFTDETTAEAQLLLDCCLYIWNHNFAEFEKNYSSELIMLRAGRQAADYAEQAEDTDV